MQHALQDGELPEHGEDQDRLTEDRCRELGSAQNRSERQQQDRGHERPDEGGPPQHAA
jgi:hypothetical protein